MTPVPSNLNQSLWKDLERRLGTSDLLEWLEVETERLANLGRTEIGAVSFSSAILQDRKIVLIEKRPHLPALQMISATPQGYVIYYSPFQRMEDRRFGIAHEIIHTFWFTSDSLGIPISPLQRAIGDDPTIEWLCNRGASALLLPRDDLVDLTRKRPYILHKIQAIAHRYVVPERLVARRLFHDLSKSHYSILAVRLQRKKQETSQGIVQWFAPSESCDVRKDIKRRIVPIEFLPMIQGNDTKEIELDGRWWSLIESSKSLERAKSLSSYASMKFKVAWVAKNEDTWYLALP